MCLIAGLEKNLRHDLEKHEELKVVEAELWDLFLQYMYVLTYVAKSNVSVLEFECLKHLQFILY